MQLADSVGAALAVIALLALSLTLASLPSQSPRRDEPDDTVVTHAIKVSDIRPVVVNATTDGTLHLRVYQQRGEDECLWEEADVQGTAFLYDREGRVDARYFDIPDDRPSLELELPLNGTPPFLLAIDPSICYDGDRSRVVNVTDGYNPAAADLWVRDSDRVEVTIPAGEQRGNRSWQPDPVDWRLVRSAVDWANRSGALTGTLRFLDARNVTVCRESSSPTAPEDECIAHFLYPGPYRITLELDRPAVQETVWPYEVDTKHWTEGICDHGFAWEGLCR